MSWPLLFAYLQQDGHNIFSNLSAADYRKNLKYIRHCIIATDLVTFFPNEKKLRELIKTNMFDILEEAHQWVNRSVSYLPLTIGRKELVLFDKNNGQMVLNLGVDWCSYFFNSLPDNVDSKYCKDIPSSLQDSYDPLSSCRRFEILNDYDITKCFCFWCSTGRVLFANARLVKLPLWTRPNSMVVGPDGFVIVSDDWLAYCFREVLVAIIMTAADLSCNYKHFATQRKTVNDLFEEFYQQVLLLSVLGQPWVDAFNNI